LVLRSYLEVGIDKSVPSLLEHDVVNDIANAHTKSGLHLDFPPAAGQRGIAIIPKTNNPNRLATNLQCDTFDLSQSDIKKISPLNISLRLNDTSDIDPRLAIWA